MSGSPAGPPATGGQGSLWAAPSAGLDQRPAPSRCQRSGSSAHMPHSDTTPSLCDHGTVILTAQPGLLSPSGCGFRRSLSPRSLLEGSLGLRGSPRTFQEGWTLPGGLDAGRWCGCYFKCMFMKVDLWGASRPGRGPFCPSAPGRPARGLAGGRPSRPRPPPRRPPARRMQHIAAHGGLYGARRQRVARLTLRGKFGGGRQGALMRGPPAAAAAARGRRGAAARPET